MKKCTIKIGKLFELLGIYDNPCEQEIFVKENIFVETQNGDYVKINFFVRKFAEASRIELESGRSLVAADKHILIDENGHQVFLENAKHIMTTDGVDTIKSKTSVGNIDLFDIGIDYPHLYVDASGIVHHNTSISKALCEELGIDYLIINCSENGNIDSIRTTVRTFASSVSLMGGFKCVIFDESDGLTNAAQQALRNFIEEFSNNCRFIFTANFGNKIIEPLKSRTVQVDMSMTKEEKMKLIVQFDARVKEILKLEGVEEYDKKVLATLITKYFPDFRKTLGTLQNLTLTGTLDASAMSNVTVDEVATIFKFLKAKDFTSMRKWVAENPDNDLPVLAKMLWGKVDSFVEHDSIPQFVLHLNQYQINHASVIDKEINLVAMLTELMADIRYK